MIAEQDKEIVSLKSWVRNVVKKDQSFTRFLHMVDDVMVGKKFTTSIIDQDKIQTIVNLWYEDHFMNSKSYDRTSQHTPRRKFFFENITIAKISARILKFLLRLKNLKLDHDEFDSDTD